MKLDRVPHRILVALGLGAVVVAEEGCVSSCLDVAPETDSVNACLSPPIEPTASESATSTSDGSESGVPPADSTSVGPCLGQQATDTTAGSDAGSGTGSDTDTATDTGTDTGSGSGSGSGTGSGSGMPAPDEPDAVIDRVLSSGTLPSDVAARLRDRGR